MLLSIGVLRRVIILTADAQWNGSTCEPDYIPSGRQCNVFVVDRAVMANRPIFSAPQTKWRIKAG